MIEKICYCDKCGANIEADEIYDIGVGAYGRIPTDDYDYVDCIEGQGFHLCADCADSILDIIHSDIINKSDKDVKKDTCDSCCGNNVSSTVWDELDYPQCSTEKAELPFKDTEKNLSNVPDTTNTEDLKKALIDFNKTLSNFENTNTPNTSDNNVYNTAEEIWKLLFE